MAGVKLTYDELKDIAAAGMTPDDARKLAFDGFSAEQILDLAQAMPKGGSWRGRSEQAGLAGDRHWCVEGGG